MPLSLVTAPDGEPITLEQAKAQAELQGTTDHDVLLSDTIIPAARDRGELVTRRQFLGPATWDWLLDGAPCERVIELPKPPLVAVSFIKYYDTAGVLQTFASSNYTVQAPQGPRCRRGRIGLVSGASWPATADQIGAFIIRFTCGYGAAEDVPPLLLQAQLMDISTLFENRENLATGALVTVPGTAQDIYRSFKSYGTQWIEE